MNRPRTFDICLHTPSNSLYFVRYCVPDYRCGDGYQTNPPESNYWLWSVMPDTIGGVYGGAVMKLICKRLSFNWFLLSVSILYGKYRR